MAIFIQPSVHSCLRHTESSQYYFKLLWTKIVVTLLDIYGSKNVFFSSSVWHKEEKAFGFVLQFLLILQIIFQQLFNFQSYLLHIEQR